MPKIHNYGQRLKEEAKKRGLSNKDMANLLGFIGANGEKQISNIYGGRANLTDDRFEILAEKWNRRIAYLKNEDDYKTEDIMLKAAHLDNMKAFKDRLRYFRSLGFEFEPRIFSILSINTIRMIYESDLWNYVRDDCKRDLEGEFGDFSLETLNKYDYETYRSVYWKRSPDLKLHEKFWENMALNEPLPDSHITLEEYGFSYNLQYVVTYNKSSTKRIWAVRIDTLIHFMNTLDSIVETSIDNLLFDNSILTHPSS